MWLFLNDAFLSIVAHKDDPNLLHIRGRFKGDIERVFPDAEVLVTPEGDYRFRASLPRDVVSKKVAELTEAIDTTKFKPTVGEAWRHTLYLDIFWTMAKEQSKRAQS